MNAGYKEDTHTLKKKLFSSLFLVVIAAALPFLSWCLADWAPEKETASSWFQRSGSLVVILAAYAEYILFMTYDYISPSNAAYVVPFDVPTWYKHFYNIISRIALTLLVVGTVIWGYGDLLHEYI